MSIMSESDMKKDYDTVLSLISEKKFTEARQLCEKLHNQDPKNLDCLGRLIEITFAENKSTDSILLCNKYLGLSDNPSVKYSLALNLVNVGSYRQALEIFDKYTETNDKDYNVLDIAARCSFEIRDYEKLHKYIEKYNLLEKKINDRDTYLTIFDKLYVHDHMMSMPDILYERYKVNKHLDELLKNPLKIDDIGTFTTPWLAKLGFPLSYHHMNNNELLKKMSQIYRNLNPIFNYVAPHCLEPKKRDKIKIGFISSFFRNHSVSKDRRGIIKLLDREKFDVYSIFINEPIDDIGREIWDSTTPIQLTKTIPEMQKSISDLELDILVYCEIGMCMITYIISHMRFAPIQIVAWGHSDTSGVDTIDYYTSSELYELPYEESQKHYSEKLILNKSLCTYYYNPKRFQDETGSIPNPDILRVFGDKNVYICPGNLIKLHPDMDIIIKKILEKDKNGVIVMIDDGKHKSMFENRIKTIIGSDIVRIGFVNANYNNNFFSSLLLSGKVVLDTFPFGGCNTSMEAFVHGIPVVTLPGEFINGRFTYGFYKKMDFMELVVRNFDDYAKKAIELATNDTYRKYVSDEILKRNHVLYENNEVIEEWNDMLLKLYNDKFIV